MAGEGMSKKVDTWMPLLVDKYLGDTTHLSTEQHGAYLLLLMSMWKKDGSLSDNDVQLAQMAKLSPAKWKAMRPIVIDGLLLYSDGERVTQKRLTAELARSKAHTNAKAEAGAKGAAKRWQKDGAANGTAMADASQSHWRTGASTPPPTQDTEYLHPPGEGQGEGDENLPDTTGFTPNAYGSMARRIRQELLIARVSSGHLGFQALINAGATFEEFEAYAEKAKTASDPFAYLVSTVTRERQRAKETAGQMHQGAMPRHEAPPVTVSSRAADDTQRYLAEQAAHQRSAPPPEILARLGRAVKVTQ